MDASEEVEGKHVNLGITGTKQEFGCTLEKLYINDVGSFIRIRKTISSENIVIRGENNHQPSFIDHFTQTWRPKFFTGLYSKIQLISHKHVQQIRYETWKINNKTKDSFFVNNSLRSRYSGSLIK